MVLDLMCGQGQDLHKLANLRVRHIVGADISPKSIDEAARRAKCVPGMPPTEFHVLDAGRDPLPVDDGTVDVVSTQFALHYLAAEGVLVAHCMGEVERVLKEGGRWVVTVPDVHEVRRLLDHPEAVPPEIALRGTLPSDEHLHRSPWGHAYQFELKGRTPPLTEYAVWVPALEDCCSGLRLVEAPRANGLYRALVFKKKCN